MTKEWPRISQLGDFVVKAGSVLGQRMISDFELVYFPKPSGSRYIIEQKVYALDHPCVILTPPDTLHEYHFSADAPTRHLFAHFIPGSFLEKLVRSKERLDFIPLVEPSTTPGYMHELMMLAAAKSEQWFERCNALLYVTLTDLLMREQRVAGELLPIEIQHAKHYMEEHLHESLSVADIATAVGWSHGHLTRSFQLHVGMNPRAFIASRRVERACQLLISSTASVKEIAYSVGFADEHYFSRCFRTLKGMTASAYRDKYTDSRSMHVVPSVTWHETEYPLNTYFTT